MGRGQITRNEQEPYTRRVGIDPEGATEYTGHDTNKDETTFITKSKIVQNGRQDGQMDANYKASLYHTKTSAMSLEAENLPEDGMGMRASKSSRRDGMSMDTDAKMNAKGFRRPRWNRGRRNQNVGIANQQAI